MATSAAPSAPATRATFRTALAVCGLAALFSVFFNVEKHMPALVAVNPFTDDPYDAIGSFGIQAAVGFSLLALYRAWRLGRANAPLASHRVLVRAELAATLAVTVSLAGDVVALARHPGLWLGAPAGYLLCGLTLALFATSIIVAYAVQRRLAPTPPSAGLRLQAVSVCVVAGALLAVYPDSLSGQRQMVVALFTAFLGSVLLIVPLWALCTALAPEPPDHSAMPIGRWFATYGWPIALVVVAGVLAGWLLAVVDGIAEGVPQTAVRLSMVALVFMGLEGSGVLIGYLFFAAPLRLAPRWLRPRSHDQRAA